MEPEGQRAPRAVLDRRAVLGSVPLAPAVRAALFLPGLHAFLFLLAISVHVTTVISRLTQQTRRLAQEVAILGAELQGRKAAEGAPPGPDQAGKTPA